MFVVEMSSNVKTTKTTIIGVHTYKGGVYKSSTTITLAASLAGRGFKVAIVDADGQCNATSFFKPPPKNWRETWKRAQVSRRESDEASLLFPDQWARGVSLADSTIVWPPADSSQALTPDWFLEIAGDTWLEDKTTLFSSCQSVSPQPRWTGSASCRAFDCGRL